MTNGGVLTKKREIVWNSDLAYAVGLFVADGHLSKDSRHLEFTSKDEEQVEHFAECLHLTCPIAKKSRGSEKEKRYFHVSWSDVHLYRFLNKIGIENRKSLTIESVNLPNEYFSDFLRGYFDGDGSIAANSHPESKLLQIKIRFASGSEKYLEWLGATIKLLVDTKGGHIVKSTRCWQLGYGKLDSLRLVKFMYNSSEVVCLKRKFNRVSELLEFTCSQ